MACNITITDAIGIGQPINAIRVFGIANECAEDPIKKIVSVKIGISCISKDGPYQEMIVAVGADGKWEALFNNPGRCLCDSEIFITAVCHNDTSCEAVPFQTRLNCVVCPNIHFGFGDDDVGQPQTITCDSDGTVLINIHFQIFNPSSILIAASVNCGPGGTEVVGGIFLVPPGTFLFVNTVICRYDPAVTLNPAPFIEFFNPADNSPLGCPDVPIPIGPLPDCNNACPTMVVLEVRDISNTVIDPEGVQCLAPGNYKVSVIVPAFVQGMTYDWSVEGILQAGNLQNLPVTVPVNNEITVSVSVNFNDCPSPSNSVDLKGCANNCDQDLNVEVKNSIGELINPDDCVDPGTYSITVTSPTGSNWIFSWVINGVLDTTTNASQHDVTVNSGESVSITITAEADGCPNKSEEITLNSCGNGGGDGGGGGGGLFSCNGLLITAITLIISGGILVIIGVCTGFLPSTITGGISTAIGLILLALWAAFCKKFTSCSVLNKLRCLLNWMALIAAIIGAIGVGLGAGFCGLTAIATGGSWALIAQLLTDIMVKKNCKITSCFIP